MRRGTHDEVGLLRSVLKCSLERLAAYVIPVADSYEPYVSDCLPSTNKTENAYMFTGPSFASTSFVLVVL